jgi:16S rRNA (adenine1518-N6/adenine1519-N6)-dimethyltransferase
MSLPPLDVQGLLRKYDLRPKRSLGQNFLVDPLALQEIIRVAEIQAGETVLEIGPGLGSLTRYLAIQARQVIAIELDARLIPALEEVLAEHSNVRLFQEDILETNLGALITEGEYLVVANIPFYITSAVVRHLLGAPIRPTRMVLTVQREVAQRICALPGKLSLLALSVQVFGKPQIKAQIPAGAFYPSPKVDSAVVRVDIYPHPQIPQDQLGDFFRLAKAGFSQKRKNLRNALSGGLGWEKSQAEELLQQARIDARRRAETLSLEEWSRLVEGYRRVMGL